MSDDDEGEATGTELEVICVCMVVVMVAVCEDVIVWAAWMSAAWEMTSEDRGEESDGEERPIGREERVDKATSVDGAGMESDDDGKMVGEA